MSQYKIGTVSATSGSSTITGSGTSWLSNLKVNDEIIIKDPSISATELLYYTVSSVISDTQITISAPYGGPTVSGAPYVAHRDFFGNRIAKFSNGDVETAGLMNLIAQAVANIAASVNIESGSNTNGRYVKFPDGTMICYHEIQLNMAEYGTGAIDDIYRSEAKDWTFPSEFTDPPAVSAFLSHDTGAVGSQAAWSVRSLGSIESSVARSLQAIGPTDIDKSITVRLTATGRWR